MLTQDSSSVDESAVVARVTPTPLGKTTHSHRRLLGEPNLRPFLKLLLPAEARNAVVLHAMFQKLVKNQWSNFQ